MSDQVERTVFHKDWQQAPRPLISSVRVTPAGGHARLAIWNRGGRAGELVVNAQDAEAILDRLIPPAARWPEPLFPEPAPSSSEAAPA